MNEIMITITAKFKSFFFWFLVTCTLLLSAHLLPLIEDQEGSLKHIKSQTEDSKQQYASLKELFQTAYKENKNFNSRNNSRLAIVQNRAPPLKYEKLRRRIHTNMKELWYYINRGIGDSISKVNGSEVIERGKIVLKNVYERKLSLLSDVEKLPETDGWQEWRNQEAIQLSDLVQKRFHYLQNYRNCSKARTCLLNTFPCGFGCQIHQIVFCFIHGYYAIRKPIFFHVIFMQYSVLPVLQPLSEKCIGRKYDEFPDLAEYEKIQKYLPLTVPKDLATRVMSYNGDPPAWWIGQIVKYILRLSPVIKEAINKTMSKVTFKSPIVGVHIRRTDKKKEAKSHDVEEYMTHVKEYYDKLELTKPVEAKRIYLATDDGDVIKEVLNKYPDYDFLYDMDLVKISNPDTRWNSNGAIALLVDVNLLSMCDYFVGTFSSQVSRLVYEMMQSNRVDASNSFVSLDDIYFFPIMQNPHNRVAVLPHKGDNNTISFKVGDFIGVAGNHWDGYGKGTNRRTKKTGLFPWYKTADHIESYSFPSVVELFGSTK